MPRTALSPNGNGQTPPPWAAAVDVGWPARTFRGAAVDPFYERLNRVLDKAGFDAFVESQCAKFYADGVGRPSLASGRYFRLLLVGYFEGLDSDRAIAWRAADSLSLRPVPGPGAATRRRRTSRRCRAPAGGLTWNALRRSSL
ncbi:MAG: transposase [Deltaproteobacteria bacterium]|nr:transposase [Deltaproteobacteria bacterium]